MATLAIMVMHSGRWDDEKCYVDYILEGVVFKENATYIEFYTLIARQLCVDLTRKELVIEYKVEQSNMPMVIHNDMGVRVYVMLKKSTNDFNRYPICASIFEKDIENINVSESSNERSVSMVGVNQMYELDEFETHQLAIEELIQPIHALASGDWTGVISDPAHKNVEVDQVYIDKATIKTVMEQYAIANRFQFKSKRSNAISYTIVCKSDDCEWTMKASAINKSGMFRIRKFNMDHTCPLKDRVYSQRQATSNLVGGLVKPKLENHKRKYTASDIKNDIKMDLGVDVTYMLAWRAKEKALKCLRGTPSGSYNKLPAYLYMLDNTYPGSHIQLKKTDEYEFLYVFVALHAFIKGFDHCRPVVVVDGSHLRGPYNGQFVSASTMDGAGHIFPLAYGIIDSENDASWTWFFEQFKEAYGERTDMCVVFDRNESIIKAVMRVYDGVQHYACIWHLWNNVKTRYRKSHGKLNEVFYSMAKAYTRSDFDRLMETVEKVDVRVKEYLQLAGYDKWARIYAPMHRGWCMTSNLAESINSTLLSARELPIFDFLEEVRLMFGRWNSDNQKEATYTFTPLMGKFQEILTNNEVKSTKMTVVSFTVHVHNVSDEGRRFKVCLANKTCSCGRFQIDEIPCEHAWVVLKLKHLEPDEYCSDLYKSKTVLKTYELPMYPLPDRREWVISEHIVADLVLPPIYKRPPGRPKKKSRDKSFSELLSFKGKNTCSTCGVAGHNRRSCRNRPRTP